MGFAKTELVVKYPDTPMSSSLLLLGLLQATHIPVLSAGTWQTDSVALSCGIYDQVLTNDLFSHLLFPGAVATPLGGCLGTPAVRLLFCRASNISGHLVALLIGTVLAVSRSWNVVLGTSCGVGNGSPCEEQLGFVAESVS